MKEPRTIVITGPFHDWELELFTKLLRDIERARPNETFMLIHDDDGRELGDAIKLVERIFPKRETPH
jgi:hypothetical protein